MKTIERLAAFQSGHEIDWAWYFSVLFEYPALARCRPLTMITVSDDVTILADVNVSL